MTPQPSSEFLFTYSRSSGPGGQHVNKVNSKVTVRWNVGNSLFYNNDEKELIRRNLSTYLNKLDELVIHEESTRSQVQNKERLLSRLNFLIAKSLVKNRRRIRTNPTKTSIKKRLDSKKKLSEKKKWRKRDF